MTDKEQIIIDETECKDYDNGCCKGSCCLNSVSIVNSCEPQNTRCDFYVNKLEEQLALKTQECEELKEKYEEVKEDRYNLNMEMYVLDRYRKALEEIEEVINNIFDKCLGHKTDGCTPVHNVCEELIKILDIINRVKEKNNGQI